MHRTNPLLFFLVTLLISLSPACAGLVDGSDPPHKPIKDAVAVLVKQITAGDFDKAKAEYAGGKKDLELLKAYVDAYTATKSMRGQLVAKFGDQYKEPVGFDTLVEKTAVIDFNSVIFDDKDPDHAAASTDTAMGTGIEFKRVGGKWKVLSLASEPETPEQHLGRLRKYIPAVKQISDKLKSGKYATAEAVDADIGSAHELLHGR